MGSHWKNVNMEQKTTIERNREILMEKLAYHTPTKSIQSSTFPACISVLIILETSKSELF